MSANFWFATAKVMKYFELSKRRAFFSQLSQEISQPFQDWWKLF